VTIHAARIVLTLALAMGVCSCDKMLASKEAQRSASGTTIAMLYTDLKIPLDESLQNKAADKVDGIPNSLSLEDRFRCYYETMVVADLARRRAGKPSFPDTGRITDDDLSAKAMTNGILLSDRPFPQPPVTEDFVAEHVAEYTVPSDGDAVFVHAVWRGSYFRAIINKFGFSGLASPEADRWDTKGRSQSPADKLYRKRANLGIGERRCYDLLDMTPIAKAGNIDAQKLVAQLAPPGK
jgi:hypothetical protein